MILDNFSIADPDKQMTYDSLRKAHLELCCAGVLADMAGYGEPVSGPVEEALRNAPVRAGNYFGVPAVFDTDEPVSH